MPAWTQGGVGVGDVRDLVGKHVDGNGRVRELCAWADSNCRHPL